MVRISFAVGLGNQVVIMSHTDRNPENNGDIDAVYKDIEMGCPRLKAYVQEHELIEGIFTAGFSKDADKLDDLTRLSFGVRPL